MRDFVLEPVVESITIHAPLERCFALSTRVELVRETLGMQMVGDLRSGNVEAGSRVHWRGWKFGLPTHHHTLITGFAAPRLDVEGRMVAWFEDSQERGRFASFRHEHFFRQQGGDTVQEDRIHFSLPLWLGGRMGETILLAPHIRRLARQRFAMIKGLAEGEGWREWVSA